MNGTLLSVIIEAFPSDGQTTPATPDSHGGPDPIYTHEERVIRVLSDSEDYRWQGEIADQLDWSASKTSRILSSMESAGEITRFQVGRRKAVCLPQQEPACLKNRQVPVPSS